MLATYDPKVFSNLDELSGALERFEERNASSVLKRIGSIICRYGMQDVVGVTMAHRHFNVNPSEKLVEEFKDNKAIIKPLTGEHEKNLTPFAWRLYFDSKGALTWFPLEFVRTEAVQSSTIENNRKIQESENFLKELAEELVRLDMVEVFGIGLVHREINVNPGEVLVESLETESRTLTFTAMPENELDEQSMVTTFWKFNGHGADIQFEQWIHCLVCQ
jgi:hypothetical protein